ncbi:MAG: putative 4-hydroxybenzoate polyprenyltransferase [Desulfurococcales archaeon]|nr:putative 4-hydroxybenzoate polyprenyltransferase [Desulfurococcales archaeon]
MGARGARPAWDPGAVSGRSRLEAALRLVRIEHTLFSLPFAYAGAALSRHPFSLGDAILMGLALLGLRTAAMAYNNIADYDIDRLNPRSRSRPLVSGALRFKDAWLVVAVGSLLYYASAALLNRYALLFSPILWLLAMSYPYAKRLHWLPHIHLGLVLGFAVFGGAIAAAGDEAGSAWEALGAVPWVYVAAVTLWVASFDIIYSTLDEDFDRAHGVGSVPARFGYRGALVWSLALALAASALFAAGSLIYRPPAGAFTLAGSALGSAVMLYGVALAWRGRENVPRAFNLNLLVGLLVSLGVIADYAGALLH